VPHRDRAFRATHLVGQGGTLDNDMGFPGAEPAGRDLKVEAISLSSGSIGFGRQANCYGGVR